MQLQNELFGNWRCEHDGNLTGLPGYLLDQENPAQPDTVREGAEQHFKFRGGDEWTGGPAANGMMDMHETMSRSLHSEQTYDPQGLPVGQFNADRTAYTSHQGGGDSTILLKNRLQDLETNFE